MTLSEALLSLAVAMAAGILIGAERQQAHAARGGADFGGIRTFPLLALIGATSALLRPWFGAWLVITSLLAVVLLLAVSHARAKDDELGISSETAGILTFALGVIAGTPELLANRTRFLLIAAVAVTAMALLALKRRLHGFAAHISNDDLYATVKFMLLALVVIPLLPNRAYGPFLVLNPFKIGIMITLVAGISFAGYLAARLIGSRRGLLVTGLVGGLVSSTAVTLTFAGRTKEAEAPVALFAVAIVAACSTMFVRVLVVLGVVDAALLPRLALPMATMAVSGYVAAAVLLRREAKRSAGGESVPLRNPFELRKACEFGLLFGVVLFVAKAAEVHAGATGVYGSAVLAGIAEVDAITLSLAELHLSGTSASVATSAIVLASITNTIVKLLMALFIGGRDLGRRVGIPLLVVLGSGSAALAVQAVFV